MVEKEIDTGSNSVEGDEDNCTSSSQLHCYVNNKNTPPSSEDEHPSHTISPGDIIKYYDETKIKGTLDSYVKSQVLKCFHRIIFIAI